MTLAKINKAKITMKRFRELLCVARAFCKGPEPVEEVRGEHVDLTRMETLQSRYDKPLKELLISCGGKLICRKHIPKLL